MTTQIQTLQALRFSYMQQAQVMRAKRSPLVEKEARQNEWQYLFLNDLARELLVFETEIGNREAQTWAEILLHSLADAKMNYLIVMRDPARRGLNESEVWK